MMDRTRKRIVGEGSHRRLVFFAGMLAFTLTVGLVVISQRIAAQGLCEYTGIPCFAAATNFAVGNVPFSVAVGDVNGDGKLDLAVANANPSNVSILIGDGAGSFTVPGPTFSVGTTPQAVAMADLNGDGKLDLVTANGSSNPGSVSVLLGNGAGGFGPATNFTVGGNPASVAIGDLNGNGIPDLVTANVSTDNVSVLYGDGAGGFGDATNFGVSLLATVDQPISVAIGDVNGDGKPDLVTANSSTGSVSVLLSPEFYGFGYTYQFAVQSDVRSVAIGDVNLDGRPDLVTANGGSSSVSVLLGNGTPSLFDAAATIPVTGGTYAVAIADLNGDGKPDLAVTNNVSDQMSVLPGDGTGAFGTAVSYGVGDLPRSIAVGHFNGDGKLDVVTVNQGSNDVSVLLNDTLFFAAGTFGPPTNFSVGASPRFLAVGDINKDGKLDFAVTNNGAGNVSVRLGDGLGSFGAEATFDVGTNPLPVAIGDINRDGWPDLVVGNFTGASLSVLLGNKTLTLFDPAITVPLPVNSNPSGVAIGDIDRNGIPDVVVGGGNRNEVYVLLGTGNAPPSPLFGTPINHAVGNNPRGVAIGDVNRDGIPDVVVANGLSDNVSVLLGHGVTGGGPFPCAHPLFCPGPTFAVGATPNAVVIVDIDRDGLPDVAVASDNASGDDVTVLLGNGTPGLFDDPATSFAVGRQVRSIATDDLNRDGIPDLVVQSQINNRVSVLFGTGTPSLFGAAIDNPVGSAPWGVATGDFDRDGRPDLAVAIAGTNNVSILLNGGFPTDLSVEMTASPPSGVSVGGKITYTVTVTNNGPSNATGIVLRDDLPAGVFLDSALTSQGSCSQVFPAEVSCLLGDLPNGDTATVTIVVHPFTIGLKTNTATVAANESDPDTVNNNASVSTIITEVGRADLSVTKTDSPDPVVVGRDLTYVVTVRNLGDDDNPGATLTDTLPAGVTFVSATPSQGTCSQDAGVVTCSLGGLNVNASANVVIRVRPTIAGLITSTATVAGDIPPAPELAGNNTAAVTTTVNAFVDSDGDGLTDEEEVELGTNPNNTDSDGDTVNDNIDNCPLIGNPTQTDTDGDGIGDACDPDMDNDGIPNASDNAPLVYNPDQLDSDGDGIPDVLDNCPGDVNPLQTDTDGDGIGDACDTNTVDVLLAPKSPRDPTITDADNDGLSDDQEASLGTNPNNPDTDGDGVNDGPDNCKLTANATQTDTDGDGIGDACDTDADNDGVPDKDANFASIPPSSGGDNCPLNSNPSQSDLDGDGVGDACDPDADGDGYPKTATPPALADCNDLDAAVNPGRAEIPGNGKDDDCSPATPDTRFEIVFSMTVTVSGADSTPSPGGNLDNWLPTDGAKLAITATVTDGGMALSPQPAIAFSVCGTCVTAYPGKFTNDLNVGLTSADYTYTFVGNTIDVTSHDFGGWIQFHAEASFADPADGVTPIFVQNDVTLPKDANGNKIADAWEALYGGNLDPNADRDASAGSSLMGDGLNILKEYRGFRWGPELVSQAIGRANLGFSYQTTAYIPSGPTRHFRTDPNRKNLFVKYTGYGGADPFALGAALYNAGIDVHVRDVATADPGEENIDVVLMTNNPGSFGFEDGRINKRALRDFSFDTRGSCSVGTATVYGGGCQTYQGATNGYFNDKPYSDGNTLGVSGHLDPFNQVEDGNDNGVDDRVKGTQESASIINNSVMDGDLYIAGFNQQLSPFDIDSNGYVELPVAAQVSSIDRIYEYTRAQAGKHVITHELIHSLGAVHDTDSLGLMYEYSNNWSRDGVLSAASLGAIMIHNQ